MKPIQLLLTLILSISFSCLSFAKNDIEGSADFGAFNIKANADLEKFKGDISIQFNVPKVKLDTFMKEVKMQPADIFLAAKLTKMSNKDIDTVVTHFKSNRGKGWGVIAKSLGIKPGSKEFHELKRTMDKMKQGQNPEDNKDTEDSQGAQEKGRGKGQGKGHGKGHNK